MEGAVTNDHLEALLASRDQAQLEELMRYLWSQLPPLAQWHVCERYGLPPALSRPEDDPPI